MSRARIEVLGEPRVVVAGEPVELASTQQQAILAMLATSDGYRVPVATIVDRLWPAQQPEHPRKVVQVQVGRLRAALADAEAIRFVDDRYELDVDRVEDDAAPFARLLDAAGAHARRGWWREARATAERALEHWRGPALGRCADEVWALPIARALDQRRLDAIELALEASVRLGDHDSVVARLDEFVDAHPERLRARVTRIHALARSGLQSRALDACREAIEQVDADERERFQQLQRRVLARDRELVEPVASHRVELPRPPRATTSLVGRDGALREAIAELDAGERILTLVGPGGVGKSRLAAELMRAISRDFDELVWIDLTETSSADAVPTLVQRQLGIAGGDSDPVETIAAALGGRRVLACLDNFEHVLDAAQLVGRLGELTDRVVLLSTSREALGIEGEIVFGVAPIVGADDAHDLFCNRAESAGGLVDDSDHDIVVELCDLVDRLPLGIELAAARTSLLTPAQVRDHLAERFDLLRTRDPSVPARQRSLGDVVEWSVDLLDDVDRHMLAALSLFVGGATIDAAADVADVTADEAAASIDRLVAKCLVVDGTDRLGQRRVTLLETVRQVMADRRTEEHVERFVASARRVVGPVTIPAVVNENSRSTVNVEAANILAALDLSLDDDVESAAWIYGGLADHYQTCGSRSEGETLGRSVLDRLGERQNWAADLARYTLFVVLPVRGKGLELIEDMRASRHRFAAQGAEVERLLLVGIADALRLSSELDAALTVLDEARAIAGGDDMSLGRIQLIEGCVRGDLGQLAEAVSCFSGALDRLSGAGDPFWSANAEVCLIANADLLSSRVDRIGRLDELADDLDRMGIHGYAGYTHVNAARLLLEGGMLQQCLERSRQCIDAQVRIGDNPSLAYARSMLAFATWEYGDQNSAWIHALAALDAAIAGRFVWCLEYASFVIGKHAVEAGAHELASLAMGIAASDDLDGRFRPDRLILEDGDFATFASDRGSLDRSRDDSLAAFKELARQARKLSVVSRS